ncbi:MAG: hypothetical protein U0802_22295 [Candidatus Binatia bacterium]
MSMRAPFALLALLAASPAAAEVRLDMSSATVESSGENARVCVSLTSGGQEVAGTQNDLVWDGACATLQDDSCFAAGTHGKQVDSRIQNGGDGDFRMRVLVLSLTDVDPIDDGELYCCDVTVEAEPGACCAIAVTNVGASDSKGNAVLDAAGGSAQLCVIPPGGAAPTPTPTATPRPAANDDDGCQVAPARRFAVAPWLAALALLLRRRRRR